MFLWQRSDIVYFSEKIKLLTVTHGTDDDAFEKPTDAQVEVWANKKSITRTEFYAANSNGIDLSIAFQVHVDDYSNQTEIIYDNKTYEVIRAYQKGEGIVELICSDKRK